MACLPLRNHCNAAEITPWTAAEDRTLNSGDSDTIQKLRAKRGAVLYHSHIIFSSSHHHGHCAGNAAVDERLKYLNQ